MKRKIAYTLMMLSATMIMVVGCGKRAVLKSNRYDDSGKEYESEYTSENDNEYETEYIIENDMEETTENVTDESGEMYETITEDTETPIKLPEVKPMESPTKSPEVKPTEAATKIPEVKPTESQTKAPEVKPTEAPAKAPVVMPTEAPTKAAETIKTHKIEGVSVAIGTEGSTSFVNSAGYTVKIKLYYAKDSADAKRYLNKFVSEVINSGKYSNFESVAIYCDEMVPEFEEIIDEHNAIYSNELSDMVYRTKKLEKHITEKYGINAKLVRDNLYYANSYETYGCYRFDFSFFDDASSYEKCLSKAKEYASEASVESDVYYVIKSICKKFSNVNYANSITYELEAPKSAFFSDSTSTFGIIRALKMCFDEAGITSSVECVAMGSGCYSFIMVSINGKNYMLKPFNCLNGNRLIDGLLIGKDIMGEYEIYATNIKTGEREVIYWSGGTNNLELDNAMYCTCAGKIYDTSYNTAEIIIDRLQEVEIYTPSKYTYELIGK